jgi:hypothetical protein
VLGQVRDRGADVRVTLSGQQYTVPRLYIAFHGLAARKLPELAARFGWRRG